MRRPHLTALLVLVSLAAAVNVGVGFLCALRVDVTELEPRVAAASDALHEVWWNRRPRGFPDLPVDHVIKDHRAVGFRMRFAHLEEPSADYELVWVDSGWPLHTFRGAKWRKINLVVDRGESNNRVIVGRTEHLDWVVFLLPNELPWLSLDVPRFIPYEVSWPGLAFNTLFYAALLWACVLLARAARGRLRTRRGRCPECGYPSAGSSVCTECGGRLETSRVHTMP